MKILKSLADAESSPASMLSGLVISTAQGCVFTVEPFDRPDPSRYSRSHGASSPRSWCSDSFIIHSM